RFSSQGGMLPEQIWDAPDMPDCGMYLGRPSGSAMPLAWAHGEYLKLLRSATDGKIFDRIPVVEARYLKKRPPCNVEIFQLTRKLKEVARGKTLRIITSRRFRLLWTADHWSTTNTLDAKHTGYVGSFADIPVPKDQKAPIEFTFYWIKEAQWQNQNYTVDVVG
ncbi:MAG TPA: hypothetical protein VMU62_09240, partial [Acidobacteriaceae bacterium]|nr:hypothetical protein [Acidobacteriaceae bacterium]